MSGTKEAQEPAEGGSDGALLMLEGHWRVERPLGHGGMGTVYLAHDLALDRPVAIKVMAAQYCGDEGLVERFEREARLMAKLEHPNLVPVYAVGRTRRGPYIVMKLLEGKTLAAVLKTKGPLCLDEVRSTTRQLAAGLQCMHERQVIHRDIKPSNIYVGSGGHVTLLDFGVARDWASDLTGAGVLVGTPRYMAPELLRGGVANDRSDLYALGTVAFEMLTGRPMVDADSERSVIRAHLNGVLLDQSQLGDVPTGVAEVLFKALAKAPEDRFESVAAFADALDAACDQGALRPPSSATRFAPLSVTSPLSPAPTRLEPETPDATRYLPPALRGRVEPPPAAAPRSKPRAVETQAPGVSRKTAAGSSASVITWGMLGLLALVTFAGTSYLVSSGPSEKQARTAAASPPVSGGAPRVDPLPVVAAVVAAPAESTQPATEASRPATEASRPPKRPRHFRSRKPVAAAPAPRRATDTEAPAPALIRCLATANRSAVRAYIQVDGLRLGATPMTLKLEPGPHRLEFLREGFKTQLRALTVASGDNLDLLVDLSAE